MKMFLPYLWSLRCLPGLCDVHAWGRSRLPAPGISPSPSGILRLQSPARHNEGFLDFSPPCKQGCCDFSLVNKELIYCYEIHRDTG